MSKIVIRLEHDYDAENPCDYDGWKAYSFSNRHANFKHPDEFEDDEDLERRLKIGLAFKLAYFEHGQCEWTLSGEGYQCRWDSGSFAGLLIWENAEDDIGAVTVEDRRKDAKAFLETYTAWCNGYVFGYVASRVTDCECCGQEEPEGEHLDSCWGFIGHEALFEWIRESMDLGGETVEFRGEASYLADYWKELVA